MEKEIEEILNRLGLSKNEVKIYLALLELGLTSSKAIIERTGLHRQIVYDTLGLLIEKGLVSFVIQANRKYFRASEPKNFLEYLNTKKEQIEQQKQEFNKILPQLEAKKEKTGEEQETTVYSGNKGVKSLLDDMLEQKKEVMIIGASDISAESYKYQMQFNIPKFDKMRQMAKIGYKIILSENLKIRAREINKMNFSEARILPKEFTSNSSTNIYGDRTSIIMWGSQPFGILIKSKEIAEAQRRHFNILWKIGKKP